MNPSFFFFLKDQPLVDSVAGQNMLLFSEQNTYNGNRNQFSNFPSEGRRFHVTKASHCASVVLVNLESCKVAGVLLTLCWKP